MDFITHCLVGAGVGRLASPGPWRPQLTLAALLGSTLMDGDAWLALCGPEAYGLYHRVGSHSIFALTAVCAVSGALAMAAARVPRWRRFGWFACPNLPAGSDPGMAPWPRFLLVAGMATALHWIFDVMTGYGNLELFWPLSRRDFSLHAINTFDAPVFCATWGWYLAARHLDWPRRRETVLALIYFLAVVLYVAARLRWSTPTNW